MRQELPFSDPRVKRLVQTAFPGAKSRRTVKFESKTTYHVEDYWSGGSRNECRFVNLATMSVLSSEDIPREKRQYIANPFHLPICDVELQPGFVVVEHVWFCGKDLGFRIYYNNVLQLAAGNTDTLFSLPSAEVPALSEHTEA